MNIVQAQRVVLYILSEVITCRSKNFNNVLMQKKVLIKSQQQGNPQLLRIPGHGKQWTVLMVVLAGDPAHPGLTSQTRPLAMDPPDQPMCTLIFSHKETDAQLKLLLQVLLCTHRPFNSIPGTQSSLSTWLKSQTNPNT